jgi:2,3-bisphosphoglycerate-independent phosphoglycerate mutase
MGNSEVGHNAIGAGRVFEQGAKRVNAAIETGEMFDGETWRWLVDGVRASGEPLHFIGLLSDGNVHSHEKHLHAMLRRAVRDGVKAARVHILLDGRDVGERSAEIYLDRLESVLAGLGAVDYRIASGGGRMHITMDRYEADWDMVARGWAVHVHGEGRRFASAAEALATLRGETGLSDQFLPSFVIASDGEPIGPIRRRGERGADQLSRRPRDRAVPRLQDDTLAAFDRRRRPAVRFAGMMQYDGDLHLPRRYLVDPPRIDRTLGEHLARNGVTQFACSETQKFGHVTYFWNGNKSGAFDEEVRGLHPHPLRPGALRRAPVDEGRRDRRRDPRRVADRADPARAHQLSQRRHGRPHRRPRRRDHRDELRRHRAARLLNGLAEMGGAALITADHGNCEEMYERDKTGAFVRGPSGLYKPRTSHTTHPVPLSLYDCSCQLSARSACR